MGVTRVGLIGALIVAVSLQSGCSFLFVNGPPANHAEKPFFECSDGNGWPVFDLIWAGLNGLGAASASNDNMNPNQSQTVGVGVAWLVVSGISAIYGFTKVSECRDAKQKRDERYNRGGMPAPGGFVPGPPGVAPVQAAPAIAPAPAAAPVPAAAPAPVAAPAPAAAPAPGSASPAPTTSLSPPRSRPLSPVHLAVRPLPSRSLAMRPALASD